MTHDLASFKERCDLVSSLRFVDAVVVDLDQDKRLAWRRSPFDVLFKGTDWQGTDKGRRLRIFYMTQASTCPPTFVCFCNDARLFHFSYQRYLENQIREVFGLTGTPVRMVVRERGDKE